MNTFSGVGRCLEPLAVLLVSPAVLGGGAASPRSVRGVAWFGRAWEQPRDPAG